MMQQCWEAQPEDRPKFEELEKRFSALFENECPDYGDVRVFFCFSICAQSLLQYSGGLAMYLFANARCRPLARSSVEVGCCASYPLLTQFHALPSWAVTQFNPICHVLPLISHTNSMLTPNRTIRFLTGHQGPSRTPPPRAVGRRRGPGREARAQGQPRGQRLRFVRQRQRHTPVRSDPGHVKGAPQQAKVCCWIFCLVRSCSLPDIEFGA